MAADNLEDYVMAPVSGIYEPLLELGDDVREGQLLGKIHSVEVLEQEPQSVVAQSDGILFARRAIPITAQGECVGVITRPE